MEKVPIGPPRSHRWSWAPDGVWPQFPDDRGPAVCDDEYVNRIGILGLIVAALLLPAISARAFMLQFEAWPTAASETCASPCYQVRAFVEDLSRIERIEAIQMDIEVRRGATPALIPTYPARNGNAGSGNIEVEYSTGSRAALPWDILSSVAKSPSDGFDALVVDAAGTVWSVESLASAVNASDTTCLDDPAKCEYVKNALTWGRIYLGFFNVTRTEALRAHPKTSRKVELSLGQTPVSRGFGMGS